MARHSARLTARGSAGFRSAGPRTRPRTLIYNTPRFNQAFRFGRNAWGTQFHFEAEPATVYDWIDTARDEAITHGVDVPNLRATTAQYGPTQVELCHRVALRFVEVVGRYAGAR